jgi:hypothetical protein
MTLFSVMEKLQVKNIYIRVKNLYILEVDGCTAMMGKEKKVVR